MALSPPLDPAWAQPRRSTSETRLQHLVFSVMVGSKSISSSHLGSAAGQRSSVPVGPPRAQVGSWQPPLAASPAADSHDQQIASLQAQLRALKGKAPTNSCLNSATAPPAEPMSGVGGGPGSCAPPLPPRTSRAPLRRPQPPATAFRVGVAPALVSWASLLQRKATSDDFRLDYFPPAVVDGVVNITPSAEAMAAVDPKWSEFLIGYFVGTSLPFTTVQTLAKRLWSKEGVSEVLSSKDFFFFRFSDAQARCSVLEGGP